MTRPTFQVARVIIVRSIAPALLQQFKYNLQQLLATIYVELLRLFAQLDSSTLRFKLELTLVTSALHLISFNSCSSTFIYWLFVVMH